MTTVVAAPGSPSDRGPGPTVASVWRGLVGSPVTDALLEWPPDLFAFADVILERGETFRFVLSPPVGVAWPPAEGGDWRDAVEQAAREWSVWAESQDRGTPPFVAREWEVVREHVDVPIEHLAEGRDWRLCEALLILHAVADEACAGLFVASDRSDGEGLVYRARGRELLARTGSLARFDSGFLRVLPKVRTPPSGDAAFSRYVCVQPAGVKTQWHKLPARHPGTDPQAEHVNMLLLPWPMRVRESDFRAVEGSVQRLTNEPFGFFEFAPADGLDLDLLDRTLIAALDEVGHVDVVVLPESAADVSEIDDLEALLDHQYNLGGALHPQIRWWEAMEVPRLGLQFVQVGEEITIVSLVCEDLAQIDQVADVIRSVCPTIVLAVLLDGPQLTSRWAARYASVLADDPGFGAIQQPAPAWPRSGGARLELGIH